MENIFKFIFSACMMFVFSSCEKIVIIDNELQEGAAKLSITTRADDNPEEGIMVEARLYIFRQSGECVQILNTEGEDNTVNVQLTPGTYTLYAVGGDDLSRFTIPTLAEVTPNSVITLQDGKVMNSFFSKQVTVTLTNGENQTLNLTLDRKVICLNKIEIKDVPADATAVEIMLSPFYNAILLNGTFPSSPITNYKVPLTKQSDGTTWLATPVQLLFPSKDEPTVSISLTTGNKSETYFYKMPDALEANHYYNISGTYKSSKASLSVTMTATSWDEERSFDFDFSDTDMVYEPTAGEYCNGYYVVSVDEQSRKAILLSGKVSYEAPNEGAAESVWRAELEARMAVLDKPGNVTNNWRLPTLEEVEIFTKDPNAVTFTEDGISVVCFCEDKGALTWAYTRKKDDGSYEFVRGNNRLEPQIRLRPVIDISY